MSSQISQGIVELKKDEVLASVKKMLQKGIDPVTILNECRQGMAIVGDKYATGEYFLSELILSAEVFKAAVAKIKPYLIHPASKKKVAKVMLATLRGDIHDLGKNIFRDLLSAEGFDVYDLGVDVDPKVVIEQVKLVRPEFLGFSALMTTSFQVMEQTIKNLANEGLREDLKMMIGGGVTTPAVAEKVGADFQTTDAIQGIKFCKDNSTGSK